MKDGVKWSDDIRLSKDENVKVTRLKTVSSPTAVISSGEHNGKPSCVYTFKFDQGVKVGITAVQEKYSKCSILSAKKFNCEQ